MNSMVQNEMQEDKSNKSGPGWSLVDWLILVVMLATFAAIVFWILSTPEWWGWCLGVLDVRDWGHWTWTGVVTGVLLALLLIRIWPEGQPQIETGKEPQMNAEEEGEPLMNANERWGEPRMK